MKVTTNYNSKQSFGMALKKPDLRGMTRLEIDAITESISELQEIAADIDLKIAKGVFRSIHSRGSANDEIYETGRKALKEKPGYSSYPVYVIYSSKSDKSITENIRFNLSKDKTKYFSDDMHNKNLEELKKILIAIAKKAKEKFLETDIEIGKDKLKKAISKKEPIKTYENIPQKAVKTNPNNDNKSAGKFGFMNREC